jgi:non-ribosomal peptide synthetase component F
VYSINRPEVTKIILALFQQRLICCPLYDTLGPKAVEFILNQADVQVACCERSKLKNLLEGKGKSLKHVILFEDLNDDDRAAAKTAGVAIYSLADLKESAATQAEQPPTTVPDDWAYIMYTSGTTGDPKGVCLTHQVPPTPPTAPPSLAAPRPPLSRALTLGRCWPRRARWPAALSPLLPFGQPRLPCCPLSRVLPCALCLLALS